MKFILTGSDWEDFKEFCKDAGFDYHTFDNADISESFANQIVKDIKLHFHLVNEINESSIMSVLSQLSGE